MGMEVCFLSFFFFGSATELELDQPSLPEGEQMRLWGHLEGLLQEMEEATAAEEARQSGVSVSVS